MLENKQNRYIHDFAKMSNFNIVGKIRSNDFSQRDVACQWMHIVNMVRKIQIYGVVAMVDEGRLDMNIKEVS